VIPVGGLSPDGARWVHPCDRFFLPVKVLSRVFRGKFVAGLKRAFRRGTIALPGRLARLADATTFRAYLRSLFRHDWVVYAKPPFGGPEHVLQYLARYTHRVAISNHRLAMLIAVPLGILHPTVPQRSTSLFEQSLSEMEGAKSVSAAVLSTIQPSRTNMPNAF